MWLDGWIDVVFEAGTFADATPVDGGKIIILLQTEPYSTSKRFFPEIYLQMQRQRGSIDVADASRR